jgi:hypothetical protein
MCDKVCLTESEARRLIHDAKKKHVTKQGDTRKPNKKLPYRPYWCEECSAWHTTKGRNPDYYR